MDPNITAYYDNLAPTYDSDRFGSSYGQFLDRQERAIISAMLPKRAQRILDLGCGTGRLSNFATHGCDASRESVNIAERRHPNTTFTVADAVALPYASACFDGVFSFHVLMHLDRDNIARLMNEVARILSPGGTAVLDIASGLRRRLRPRTLTGWHGATSLTCREMGDLGQAAGLSLKATAGILMVPIHRVSPGWRRPLAAVDRRLGATVPNLASYIVARFVRESAP